MATNGLLPLPEFLRATAVDFANARMRKAGRTKWSRGDYNACVDKLNTLVASHYGEGMEGNYRFQIAEGLVRAGAFTLRTSLKQLHSAIDEARYGSATEAA